MTELMLYTVFAIEPFSDADRIVWILFIVTLNRFGVLFHFVLFVGIHKVTGVHDLVRSAVRSRRKE